MSEIKTNKISPRKGTTTTIGDSGDTISLPSGTSLNIQGTYSGINSISWDTTAKTTNFTAETNKGYFINTTSGEVTITLPATPIAGSFIGIKDYASTAQTNNIVIGSNGNKIQGQVADFRITTQGGAVNLVYVDSTQGWLTYDAAQASDIAQVALFTTATGGTITTCGDYKIHTFTAPGTFCVSQIGNGPTNPAGGPTNVDYLVIAGGGGGGQTPTGPRQGGGGGGAGGLRVAATSYTLPVPAGAGNPGSTPAPNGACVSALPISVTAYPITVGGGGSTGNPASAGSTSTFSTITAAGGGKGGSPCSQTGGAGGSGGGSSNGNCLSGGSGNTPPVSPAQGRNGGATNAGQPGGGGGGGADLDAAVSSGPGLARSAGNGNCSGAQFAYGGRGGKGLVVNITGSCVSYAGGGGGGGSPYPGFPCETSGGGGSACKAQSAYGAGYGSSGPGVSATSGTANTGGGGGGGGTVAPSGGAGGSGIVIIRYKYQ